MEVPLFAIEKLSWSLKFALLATSVVKKFKKG